MEHNFYPSSMEKITLFEKFLHNFPFKKQENIHNCRPNKIESENLFEHMKQQNQIIF